MTDAFLLADKGPDLTSFQVVAQVRRLLRIAKVGHGGTLDPMATGLLPLLCGEATRLQPFLQAEDKEYVATIRLGLSTDTLDRTGRVIREAPVPAWSVADLEPALAGLRGEIEQVPPMFSALHVGGRRLHELARAGLTVERSPRRVRIDALEVLAWESPLLTVRVACGKGTYVRSLAADLGATLGCGGALESLRRTRIGIFRVEEAVPWPVIRDGEIGELRAALRPPDDAVRHLPALEVGQEVETRLRSGQTVPVLPGGARPPEGTCRLYGGRRFLGLGEGGPSGLRILRWIGPAGHENRLGSRGLPR